jgi:phage shock protein A
MGILARFKDIMSANINALLDKAEDPEKMIDQYLRNLNSDLGKVKAETASVMAEERRAKRAYDENREEIVKMEQYAIKALEAGNESDARKFLERKAALAAKDPDLQQAWQLAATNAQRMKQMHDKLVADIGELESRRAALKAKWTVAKTQERVNKLTGSADSGRSFAAFERMEERVNRALDEAEAMAELNAGPKDDIEDLKAKYDSAPAQAIDDELAALKARIQNKGGQ